MAAGIVGDPPASFFDEPLHPYSQKLMASVPRLKGGDELEFITGQPPSLLDPPTGCRFADRCPARFDKCDLEPPTFRVQGRRVKCWLHEEDAESTVDETASVQAWARPGTPA